MDVNLTPILTARATARHLGMNESTLDRWIKSQDQSAPLIHAVTPVLRGAPRMPFTAVIEAYVLNSLRELKFSFEQIERAARLVRTEFNDEYALASKRIAHDGVDLFVEIRDDFVRTHDQQTALRDVVQGYLKYIQWDETGRAKALKLKRYGDRAPVFIDPRFNWGAPALGQGRIPVDALADLWAAGEHIDDIAEEFNLTRAATEDVLRAARAA